MPQPTDAQREQLRRQPSDSVVMYQSWRELLFLHWEWDAQEVQRTLPPGLTVDLFDGRCFIGVVPFKMRSVRPRFLPAVGSLSNFLELNLRTYVYDSEGRPGVWFYSLDANQRTAVALARRLFSLPYHRAEMATTTDATGLVDYRSARTADRNSEDRFVYRPRGDERYAELGTLEYFLLERYLLFTNTRTGLRSGQVHHTPYPFQDVAVEQWGEELFRLNDFTLPARTPDHALCSAGVDVSVYGLKTVGAPLSGTLRPRRLDR